jgi:hypothetical protein
MSAAFSIRVLRIGSLAALVLVGGVITAPRVASAANTIFFEAPIITVTQEPYDQTGTFDVTIFQPGGGSSLFQFEADLQLYQPIPNSGSNITEDGTMPNFENAALNYNVPYVMNGNSGNQSNSILPFLDNYPGPSSEVENSDEPNTNVGVPLSATPLSLMGVEWDVPANSALGSYAMLFTQNTSGYDFVETTSYSSGNYFLPNVINGAINVVPSPEPSSIVMMVLGTLGLIGLGLRRARRA